MFESAYRGEAEELGGASRRGASANRNRRSRRSSTRASSTATSSTSAAVRPPRLAAPGRTGLHHGRPGLVADRHQAGPCRGREAGPDQRQLRGRRHQRVHRLRRPVRHDRRQHPVPLDARGGARGLPAVDRARGRAWAPRTSSWCSTRPECPRTGPPTPSPTTNCVTSCPSTGRSTRSGRPASTRTCPRSSADFEGFAGTDVRDEPNGRKSVGAWLLTRTSRLTAPRTPPQRPQAAMRQD